MAAGQRASGTVELGLLVRIAAEVHIADPKALLPDHRVEGSQEFVGNMLADQ